MDKTITRRATFVPFLVHAMCRVAPWRAVLLPGVGVALLAYGLRRIDRGRLKAINQRLLLGRAVDGKTMAGVAQSFAAATISGNCCPGARARIAADKAAGYTLVMATASNRAYAGEIAVRLGFDACIATETMTDAAGRATARILGENCYGPAKRRMVEAWLAAQGIARHDASIRFYSDHVSDAPMFDFADEATAVNAHAPLRRLAHKRGWALADW